MMKHQEPSNQEPNMFLVFLLIVAAIVVCGTIAWFVF